MSENWNRLDALNSTNLYRESLLLSVELELLTSWILCRETLCHFFSLKFLFIGKSGPISYRLCSFQLDILSISFCNLFIFKHAKLFNPKSTNILYVIIFLDPYQHERQLLVQHDAVHAGDVLVVDGLHEAGLLQELLGAVLQTLSRYTLQRYLHLPQAEHSW